MIRDCCISDLVAALNAFGLATVASCCRYGTRPGNIALADGRELLIAKDFAEARKMEMILAIQQTEVPMDVGVDSCERFFLGTSNASQLNKGDMDKHGLTLTAWGELVKKD